MDRELNINIPNLIAISGKIGSGKDLIGKIIQYLSYGADEANISFEKWNSKPVWNTKDTKFYTRSWEIKKFATKVKEIFSSLTGISIADFEKEKVKNSYLGIEWQRFQVIDTSNRIPIHRFACYNDAFSFKERQLKALSYLDLKIQPYAITVREALQFIGTDLFRNRFHPGTFVNALFSEYKLKTIKGKKVSVMGVPMMKYKGFPAIVYPNWLITDLRFKNEAQAVLDRNGVLIRINRPIVHSKGIYTKDIKAVEKRHGAEINRLHSSETELDNYDKFHYTINNSGSIEDLIKKVKEILIDLKLL